MSKIKYQQSTGKVWIDDKLQKTVGYAGHGEGVNNPDLQHMRMIGPIPVGLWKIGTWVDHPHLGRMVSHLLPISVPNQFGRSEFFIHGDNKLANKSASNGCIILDYNLRLAVKKSGAKQIEVIR